VPLLSAVSALAGVAAFAGVGPALFFRLEEVSFTKEKTQRYKSVAPNAREIEIRRIENANTNKQ